MIWFLACVAIALWLTAHSAVNLVRDRFPHPADVATISICYYGVPLAICGYFDLNYEHMVFLAGFAADQSLAALSIRFLAIALVALHMGRLLAMRAPRPTLTRFAQVNRLAIERLRLTFLALILLIGAGIYLFGLSEFLSGYATEGLDASGSTGNAVIYITLEFMGLSIAYALILGMVTGRIPFKLLIAATMVILLVILAIRAKRLEVVSAFIPPAVILMSKRSGLNSAAARLVLGAGAIAVLVIVSALRADYNLNAQQGLFLFFSEGLYAGHALPGITERLQTQLLNYEYGARFLNSLLGFIPRFVWEGKDDMVYAGNLALKGVAPLGATTFVAETVLQGGWIAVALVHFLIGYVFERIMRFKDAWDDSLAAGFVPARVGAYLVAIAIFIPHFRDGIIPAVKLSLQAGVFFALVSGMRLIGKPKVIALPLPPGSSDEARGSVLSR
ncbi:O-antigen polymerase [Sphingomonas sp. Tas61C01]|uniref:O-antigen polymerase n=1 Tax=Sphingomonas sp. Tas61C01 TaxID=3458297 RepID=UPI00403E7643